MLLAMIGEIGQLVTDKPFEFEKQPVEAEDCRKLLIILEESKEYTPIW